MYHDRVTRRGPGDTDGPRAKRVHVSMSSMLGTWTPRLHGLVTQASRTGLYKQAEVLLEFSVFNSCNEVRDTIVLLN